MTAYRIELGIGAEQVVMYAGNVGFSQSLDMLLHAARQLPNVTFVINGGGSALESLRGDAAGLANVRFGPYQPRERLSEVLGTGDLHVVPLRAGLARVSVPSKTYSILAAGRPVVAAVDPGTEVANIVNGAQCGVAIPPDDAEIFTRAIRETLKSDQLAAMGDRGRRWVEHWASPAAVAAAYESLFAELA